VELKSSDARVVNKSLLYVRFHHMHLIPFSPFLSDYNVCIPPRPFQGEGGAGDGRRQRDWQSHRHRAADVRSERFLNKIANCLLCISLGCKVAIASRNLEKLEAAAEEMSKFGDCHPIQCNIREEEDAKQV
jgi:hypothetical protein